MIRIAAAAAAAATVATAITAMASMTAVITIAATISATICSWWTILEALIVLFHVLNKIFAELLGFLDHVRLRTSVMRLASCPDVGTGAKTYAT
jgi:hypothetical protein